MGATTQQPPGAVTPKKKRRRKMVTITLSPNAHRRGIAMARREPGGFSHLVERLLRAAWEAK